MIHGHAGDASDELEVREVVLVAQARVGVDLERVVVRGRVLEEAIIGIEHLLAQEVEPFSRHTPIVEADLAVKLDPELRLQNVHLMGGELDLPVRVLQDGRPPHLDLELVRDVVGLLELLLKILVLALVVPVVGDGGAGDRRVGDPGVLPLGLTSVVVDKEDPAVGVDALLPTLGQRPEVVFVPPVRNIRLARQWRRPPRPRIDPGGLLVGVIDVEHAAVGSNLHCPARGQALGVQLGGRCRPRPRGRRFRTRT